MWSASSIQTSTGGGFESMMMTVEVFHLRRRLLGPFSGCFQVTVDDMCLRQDDVLVGVLPSEKCSSWKGRKGGFGYTSFIWVEIIPRSTYSKSQSSSVSA